MRKFLLVCGVLSSLLYLGLDILVSLQYEGYSYTSQVVSELNATGAPTRSLFVALSIPYNLLVAAFGVAVWASARKRATRITGAMLVAFAVVSQVTPLFFPMPKRGTEGTSLNALHGPMTAVQSLFILLAMGLGATVFERRFRFYSLGTILTLVVFGLWTGLYVPQIAAGQPTPWVGVIERINIYATMLWVAVLAISLFRVQETTATGMSTTSKGEVRDETFARIRTRERSARRTA